MGNLRHHHRRLLEQFSAVLALGFSSNTLSFGGVPARARSEERRVPASGCREYIRREGRRPGVLGWKS